MHLVAGLRELAAFLEEYEVEAPMNEASANYLTYHVLEDDAQKAFAEFRDISDFVSEYADTDDVSSVLSKVVDYGHTRHHETRMQFGPALGYKVLWIERHEGEHDE
jgi:hypothetical protein